MVTNASPILKDYLAIGSYCLNFCNPQASGSCMLKLQYEQIFIYLRYRRWSSSSPPASLDNNWLYNDFCKGKY